MRKLALKYFSFILTAVFFSSFFSLSENKCVFASFASENAYILMSEDVNYDFVGTKQVAISLKTNSYISSRIEIPERMTIDCEDYTVTAISNWGFSNSEWLKNIDIPKTVNYIGVGAFNNCENLEKVTIRGNLSSIGRMAFSECRSLHTVVFLDDVKEIFDSAFDSCQNIREIFYYGNVNPIVEESLVSNNKETIVHVLKTYEFDDFCYLEILKDLNGFNFYDYICRDADHKCNNNFNYNCYYEDDSDDYIYDYFDYGESPESQGIEGKQNSIKSIKNDTIDDEDDTNNTKEDSTEDYFLNYDI